MSNYEYLRSLPLEQMAKEIVNLPLCTICEHKDTDGCYDINNCSGAAVEWLKSEKTAG